jgi:hypothetical protein
MLNGFGKIGQAVTRVVPGLTSVATSEEEAGTAAEDAAAALERAAGSMESLVETLEKGFQTMAQVAQESFGQVGTAAEEADAAVSQAMVGGSVTSSVETAATTVQSSADLMVTSFEEIGAAADAAEAQVAAATTGMEASMAGAGAASEAAGAASMAGGAEMAGGAAATGLGRTVVTGAAGAGEVGAGSAALLAAAAGFAAFQGTTLLLKHNVLGLGTATQKLTDNIMGWFGADPRKNSGAFQGNAPKAGSGTVKYLEEIALGLTKSKTISASQARTDLHSTGLSDTQINASKGALIAAFSPAAKSVEIAANDFQIANDKNLLWIASAQAATDKQHGVSDKSAKAAEKTLQANMWSLTVANQQLSGVQENKAVATVAHKASTVHLNAAQMHANAVKADQKASTDTTNASNDMANAAKALVDGQTKTATMWEHKASKLDTAATSLETAAEMWTGGMEKALAVKGPAYPGQYTAMNAPKHASGGVTFGPSFGEIGEAGQEAILPLTNPRAMSSIAEAITSATGGAPSSQSTVFQIENLVVTAQNPQQLQAQLQQRARLGALSSTPSGSVNLGVAV